MEKKSTTDKNKTKDAEMEMDNDANFGTLDAHHRLWHERLDERKNRGWTL